MAGLQSGEGRMTIDSVVWAQYVNVTDTQTYRHTDSQAVSSNADLTHCIGPPGTHTCKETTTELECDCTCRPLRPCCNFANWKHSTRNLHHRSEICPTFYTSWYRGHKTSPRPHNSKLSAKNSSITECDFLPGCFYRRLLTSCSFHGYFMYLHLTRIVFYSLMFYHV